MHIDEEAGKISKMSGARMVTLDSDVFKCCHKVETLGWNNDVQAKSLLQRAADQVKPIMVRRKWAVPLLTEFYPPMPNLLGMNHDHGAKIEVRLRLPSDRDAFLPYESILGTLLHELAHIEVGPHNAQFYKLLDELQDECDTLIAKGIGSTPTPNGISTGGGNRLGGTRPTSRHLSKERSVAAAQERRRISRLMPQGGRALGGDDEVRKIAAICDPREMAVAAAQRRLNDDKVCAVTTSSTSAPTSARASSSQVNSQPSDDVVEVIDVDAIPSPVQPRPQPPQRRSTVSRVPIRQSPAALAALKRAQLRSGRYMQH